MASSPTISRSTISYINQELGEPGRSNIFVNGVNNHISKAEESALHLSRWLGGTRVVLFYNPTRLEDSEITAEQTISLVHALSYLIENEERKCRDSLQEGHEVKVSIFSHSHGSVLTKNAIQLLESTSSTHTEGREPLKNRIQIISFGGGVLIPNRLGAKVHNFVNEFDLIPLLANIPVPSQSDADRLMRFLSADGQVQQIYSEILLCQNEDNSKAAQAVQSSLVGYHQIECFGKSGELIDRARSSEEAMGRVVISAVTLFEGLFFQVARAFDDEYNISIQKFPDSPPLDEKTISMLVEIIKNPYRGQSICHAFTLTLQQKINFLAAHEFSTYLKSVPIERALS